VAVFEERPETLRGRMLYEALLTVHTHIRGGLNRVQRLATAVRDGLPAEGLHEELESLKADNMVWQFQVSCLRYCSFVHLHHLEPVRRVRSPAGARGRRARCR
jgi:hypothetical protein